jgi:dihydrofolate reductase
MLISAIAALTRNRVIGKDNQIPWYLPADLKFFKRTTLGHHILMGRKNYESLGKPLPKRTNVVITRDPYFISTGCIVVHSIEEALQVARDNGEEEAFIIGGGEIYAQSLPLIDKMYLSEIDAEIEGDVFFPEFDRSNWVVTSEDHHPADERNAFPFTVRIYERKKS